MMVKLLHFWKFTGLLVAPLILFLFFSSSVSFLFFFCCFILKTCSCTGLNGLSYFYVIHIEIQLKSWYYILL